MVWAQLRGCPGEWDTQTHRGFWHTNGSTDVGQATKPYNFQQKQENLRIADFAAPVDHRMKLKENENKDKYQHHARELKKLWNMKMTFIPIVMGALGTFTKELIHGQGDLEIRRRTETIQTTTLLRTARIQRRFLET